MKLVTEMIPVDTEAGYDAVDITDKVERLVGASHLDIGSVCVFVPGSTAGLTTIEYEPGLVSDLRDLFDRVSPTDMEYAHNERWHDGNGHSHVRAALMGPSLVVPFIKGRLTLGQWQQIVLFDFDVRQRHRDLICQVWGAGEKE